SSSAGAAICEVTTLGTNAGAATWASPVDLQTALDDPTCTEIWVKAGTYKPTTADSDPRMATFLVQRTVAVAIYGGFAGNETQRDARSPATHPTILSGDIGIPGDNSDNSYHVVYMDGTLANESITASTVLDGFTISDGNANAGNPENSGGGLYCNGQSATHRCSPTLSNLVFSGNHAGYGGALYNYGHNRGNSSPILSNVVFSGNSATYVGAMYNDGSQGTSSPVLNNVTFNGNSATNFAGAMYNDGTQGASSPTLNNVTFSGNIAGTFGGAMYFDGAYGSGGPILNDVTFSANTSSSGGGAMYSSCNTGNCSPMLSNVTFSGNTAGTFGGAMFNEGYNGILTPILNNVTFSGNSANLYGGAIFNSASGSSTGNASPTLSNVILWGDSLPIGAVGPEIYNDPGAGIANPGIDHSVVQGSGGSVSWDTTLGTDGGGNIDADPMLGALADNGGATLTRSPGVGSSAIDTGDDGVCGNPQVHGVDQRGVTRPQGAHCDIGAVEYVPDLIFADGFDGPPI
ncbi:MAG: choice-of-anchor Q domain-containing protein, partial [Rudaea sp.]